MPRIIRSTENQKKHQKKMRILSAVFLLCIVGLAWLVVWVPSLTSLQIKNIIVHGNKVLKEDEIKQKVKEGFSGNYLRVFPKTNVFLYPKETVEKNLVSTFPRIANVSAELDTERILTISLTEREPFALWCGREILVKEADKSCFYLDNQGFVFARTPHFSGNMYFEFYGKGILPENESIGHDFLPFSSYQHIFKIKEHLESFKESPMEIVVADDGSAEFTEKGGYKIRFNLDGDISALLSNMQAVFRSNLWGTAASSGGFEYLDFRFGNKVYYKYKNKESGRESIE